MQALAVFTNRGIDRLLAEGGSQAWKLKPERVKKLKYLVCVQNRDDGDWGEPTHEQGQGFFIGKIRDVQPSPEERPGRYIILVDEYAEIDKPDMAHQWRNPVRYIQLEEFGIDPDRLTFKPVGTSASQGAPKARDKKEPPRAAPLPATSVQPLDMGAAKKALAAHYRVPVAAIEITIRG
jgi:hypothetical protein